MLPAVRMELFVTFILIFGWISTSYCQLVEGDCTVYDQGEWSMCKDDCGNCFNPLGRSTTEDVKVVMCDQESTTGYLCAPDGKAYACMDWTFGSQKMQRQEKKFEERTGNKVWFGVGTFGTEDDVMMGLGACYRLHVQDTNCDDAYGGEPLEREIIAQAINTGHDVSNIQFDLQVGNGGTGAFNSCAGSSTSIFPGPFDESVWGAQYGGCNYRDSSEGSPSCDSLPPYTQERTEMESAGDNLIDLCKYSFDNRARKGAANPTITDMARVECPEELVEMTQLKRIDDPNTYEILEENRPKEYQNGANVGPCQCSCEEYQGCKYCMTRMMDCRKPSGGWITNLDESLLEEGLKVVQFCTQDGYTRIDVKCGCYDCNC